MVWEKITNAIGLGPNAGARAAVAELLGRLGLDKLFRASPPHQSAAFTSAFVALAAKMAKADGVAVLIERDAFERFLETPPEDVPRIRRLYDLAKQDTSGFEAYAERIARLLRDEPETTRCVLECLIYVACSDGILHPTEDAFLRTVAEKFGLSSAEFRRMRAMFVRDSESPYEILGIAPDASDAEIKAHFRRLVTELHPDKLIAAGAQPPLVKAATAKLATINAAYEEILKERAMEKGA
jgi:DnaJ like chaperone protein